LISYFGYKVINKLTDMKIPKNTGDFRIMTRRVINELRNLNESHGFLRGLVAYIGFKQTCIEYDRDERFAGKGNYNRFTGSLKIGLNGLISFSSRPLQMMSIMGAVIAGFSFLLGSWYVIQKIMGFGLTPGLSTTVLVVTFFSGIQLLCLGLMGEYVGRIYDEVKRRPMFIIDQVVTHQNVEALHEK
jgi:dolichol-phosphate mannosyltransferase